MLGEDFPNAKVVLVMAFGREFSYTPVMTGLLGLHPEVVIFTDVGDSGTPPGK